MPGDAPSASSLNGFSSGNGYGVYGGGSGGNEYGYGGQSYSGPTGSDWAMNYGGGMSAADSAAQWAGYENTQNQWGQMAQANNVALANLQATYGPTTTFQDPYLNGYTAMPGTAITNWGAPTAQSQFNQNIASQNYGYQPQYSFI